ncbi:hypothetical protein [Paludisphaera mucosa]|uniref:Uncharacterized protein n=1 Tax=Paludisphaera mucosa TaxID=3030827 RepID=A0ABT6FAV4_9BACT|nr:hypothetical protein [Paludisphaera mucosa]MDG3004694.1 hypothetical protein [Paludisphaera mucosa]
MSQDARVLSVQALRDFKGSMIKFVEEARGALSGVDMELRRMRDFLERDQLGYWQMQIKKRSEAVMNARSELAKRQIAAKGNSSISDTEQKENLRIAMQKLRVAEEKLALVKKLIPVLHHEIAEYKSCASPLGDHLSGGFERSLGTLEKMVRSLEDYLALQAPTTARDAPLGSSARSAEGVSAAGPRPPRPRPPEPPRPSPPPPSRPRPPPTAEADSVPVPVPNPSERTPGSIDRPGPTAAAAGRRPPP